MEQEGGHLVQNSPLLKKETQRGAIKKQTHFYFCDDFFVEKGDVNEKRELARMAVGQAAVNFWTHEEHKKSFLMETSR